MLKQAMQGRCGVLTNQAFRTRIILTQLIPHLIPGACRYIDPSQSSSPTNTKAKKQLTSRVTFLLTDSPNSAHFEHTQFHFQRKSQVSDQYILKRQVTSLGSICINSSR